MNKEYERPTIKIMNVNLQEDIAAMIVPPPVPPVSPVNQEPPTDVKLM